MRSPLEYAEIFTTLATEPPWAADVNPQVPVLVPKVSRTQPVGDWVVELTCSRPWLNEIVAAATLESVPLNTATTTSMAPMRKLAIARLIRVCRRCCADGELLVGVLMFIGPRSLVVVTPTGVAR